VELERRMRKRVDWLGDRHRTGILLYDEPTTGLDPILADAIQ